MENLTKEIEDKESKMVKYISEYHMSILDKCNKLVDVKNKVPKILEDNESVISSFKDISIQYSKIEQEVKTYEQLDSRIKKVISVLGKLEDFFKHTFFDYENDALYFYRITVNLIKLRDLRKDFFDFSFYDNLNEIFVKYNNKVKDEREILYKKWKKRILQNAERNAKSILKIFDEDHESSGQKLIFPEINTLRSEFLSTDFLILIWIYKKTDKFEDFIDRLNIDRISIIDGYADKTNALHSYVSEFLLSYFLIQISKGINPHYEELLSSLNKYFFNRSQLNLHDTKNIIIPFRNLLDYIKVEDNVLEETIGKIAMDYFESHEFKNGDFTKLPKDQFKISLKKFINDSQDFISKIKQMKLMTYLPKK
ncbi:hypothetical protein NBO_865g0001 [Nosema bombycis CQ1]|uniref:Exocyst complex component Sec6 n=1 Tax=Nosema bombycis (strain CQ1 / CVCC 102059) TaxID=578461 RepID=R0MCK3_NOSB1|nr:hypothetical protein NBO_865g0001 [Nosema bombycis CQ1]|eukprot:EOB11775.1 hypothetical protein NBO_865g0001 [Nosema bombycis CQ1]